tara:strand:- start:793 stop:1296 length:504 start_codon:yes stop_codon:yes gene_type:complete
MKKTTIAATVCSGVLTGLLGASAQYNADGSALHLDYCMADVRSKIVAVGLSASIEVLGAGDGVGFATPMATRHKFQGWPDMFMETPGDGTEDIYLGVVGKIGRATLKAIYHDFSADDTHADWGSELDFIATWAATEDLTTQRHYADFHADKWKVNTKKFRATLPLKL